MAKLSIKELTSRSMLVMILTGCLDRLTTEERERVLSKHG